MDIQLALQNLQKITEHINEGTKKIQTLEKIKELNPELKRALGVKKKFYILFFYFYFYFYFYFLFFIFFLFFIYFLFLFLFLLI